MALRDLTRNAPAFVYALHDPETWTVFYVGVSVDPATRARQHLLDPGSAAYDRCQALVQKGLTGELVILCKCDTRSKAFEIETKLLNEYQMLPKRRRWIK
jgi:predicted GIY-YIG superfamily endonuclease